ncbi:MAG: aspartate-alanine antiporter [Bacteroides sp.]|nr:aspartate-alanine antiporter [Bacteroides sp.]MCM1412931.1 aspartate-alanine antiporter [Bacteroides sp.]MCM1471600.1 aspartate-alanine antiporter [Bacteroides sp.]
MDWILETMRNNPSIPIFLTIGIGFWIGQLKYKTFSLGTVTSVLLVGVLVGQMDIPIPGPIKNVFFLLFLFAIGYSVGPQFFRALRGSGLKQVFFAVVVCVLCLVVTLIVAKLMHYNVGEAIGLFSGAQTISAVIGVGSDTMSSMGMSAAEKQKMIDIIPVGYAVTYVFGTIGSAYILANLGPAMLGGIKKVKADTVALEKEMNESTLKDDPAYITANRPVAFRAYKATADFFSQPRTVADIEQHLNDQGRRLFVERVRQNGTVIDPQPTTVISLNDEVVLSGRREFIIEDESWIGPEVSDPDLLNFPAEQVNVMITKKTVGGMTVDQVRGQKFMYGVTIKAIDRGGTPIPVFAKTVLEPGDTLTIIGLPQEVNTAGPKLGYVDRPTTKTNLILVGFGIALGCILGVLTLKIGNVPVSLSTSGGSLISGLVCGWLRSRRPSFGGIPSSSVWLLNNLGLNMFIAVIGITAGPSFVSGIKEVGLTLFFMGIICTTIPLILAIIIGAKCFKFRPAINLGCCAGSRTTTASLGAIQDALGSTLPAMGYTITYAIGNTLLILWGVVIVLCMV